MIPENKNAWRLGILNLEKSATSLPFIEHDYARTKAFVDEFPLEELKDEVQKNIEMNKSNYRVR